MYTKCHIYGLQQNVTYMGYRSSEHKYCRKYFHPQQNLRHKLWGEKRVQNDNTRTS
jgi:hypothetical protein